MKSVFSSVQFSSVAQSCPTLCDRMNLSTPGLPITNSQSLLKLMPIKSVMPSSHLILCCPLLLLPPTPPNTHLLIIIILKAHLFCASFSLKKIVVKYDLRSDSLISYSTKARRILMCLSRGFPGGTSGKESTCHCSRHRR